MIPCACRRRTVQKCVKLVRAAFAHQPETWLLLHFAAATSKLRMHYVGYAEMAAAVSNAGGLGTLASHPMALHMGSLLHLPMSS